MRIFFYCYVKRQFLLGCGLSKSESRRGVCSKAGSWLINFLLILTYYYMAGIGKGNAVSPASILPSDKKGSCARCLSYVARSRRACFRDSQNTPSLEPHSNLSAPPSHSHPHPHSPHVEGYISLPLIPMQAFDALLGHPRCTGGRWSSSAAVPSPTLGRHVGFSFLFLPAPLQLVLSLLHLIPPFLFHDLSYLFPRSLILVVVIHHFMLSARL